ncbi:ATP synthase mitochondrial F1 complex assembly factor 1 isoform X1 [Gracilinanus agilis]|uniref:ATP synthase mitochondrial F1 complex assembly factor 1 isoform X1 n=2 Tax=Gracilinanus agilis TaxID=191870 RepID=UPI001CFDD79A|nr:ATP synthase mitochondrial F1 complex assembly factor 1 isoform X1 [Gracilinanus agilis]
MEGRAATAAEAAAAEATTEAGAEVEDEERETMAAAMAAIAAGGAGPAVLQVAGLYRGLCAVRSRALGPGLGLGLVGPEQLRLFSVRRSSGSGGEELETNPYFDKYRDKIQKLRRSDPAVFKSRLEKRSELQKQPVGHSKQADFIKCVEQKTEALGKQSLKRGFTKDKTLSSIFNIEMVKDKTAAEIQQIWQQYFATKDTVYAVIPAETFDLIWSRAQKCPSFLCALPRREGYEFFVGQWSASELHFTALINIQTRGEAAASQLILYHFSELKKDKGIVLMTAEMDSTFLKVPEAQCIANQVQLFYATDRKETFGLVETFNLRPNEFKYMSVIAELEQSGIGADLKLPQKPDTA